MQPSTQHLVVLGMLLLVAHRDAVRALAHEPREFDKLPTGPANVSATRLGTEISWGEPEKVSTIASNTSVEATSTSGTTLLGSSHSVTEETSQPSSTAKSVGNSRGTLSLSKAPFLPALLMAIFAFVLLLCCVFNAQGTVFSESFFSGIGTNSYVVSSNSPTPTGTRNPTAVSFPSKENSGVPSQYYSVPSYSATPYYAQGYGYGQSAMNDAPRKIYNYGRYHSNYYGNSFTPAASITPAVSGNPLPMDRSNSNSYCGHGPGYNANYGNLPLAAAPPSHPWWYKPQPPKQNLVATANVALKLNDLAAGGQEETENSPPCRHGSNSRNFY